MGENMKRNNKKNVVKTTKFSDIISTYRAERKLTQKQLGEIIGVSDRTISKWEKGDTEPDLYHVKKICKTLDIPPSNLVIYKKTLKDRLNKIWQISLDILRFIKRNLFKIIFIILFIFLSLYFINNYNAIKIYTLKYESENIYFNNGYFYKTKSFSILSIENISLKKINYEPASYNIELYTYKNGDKEVLYQKNTLKNIHIEETIAANDILNKDVIRGIKEGLNITITTTDEDGNYYEYDCKISLKEKYNSNKLFYTQFLKNGETNIDYPIYYNNNLPTINETPTLKEIKSLEDLGYSYNKNNNSYIKIDKDGGMIEYMPHLETINYTLYNKENDTKLILSIRNNKYAFMTILKNKDEVNEKRFLINNNKIILTKNQKNINIEKVQYLLDMYKEIITIL